MDYAGASDSSGTDDDLPPSHQNRFHRGGGRAAGNGNGNGRSGMLGNASLPRVHSDMESQIHQIEQEAYFAVLRAFKAQADAISWEKEGLMTELRKELRVSDDEHRVVLSRVNADDMIHQIREWREGGGFQLGRFSTSQTLHDPLPSPTVSASFKKQKTTKQSSLSTGAPSPGRHPSKQPSSSALRGEPPSRSKNKKSKPYPSADGSGRVPGANRGSLGASTANKPAETANFDPLIGKKVWTRWPEDNNFYEAVITDYDPAKGLHSLVYEINTDYQSWEWVNLKEIPPEDIRWEGEYPRKGGRPGPGPGQGPGAGLAQGRVVKKAAARGGPVSSIGRGRGTTTKGQTRKVFQSSQNGSGKKPLGDIEILHTETLIKELEKVFSLSNLDPIEMEKAKKVLKDHEEALENAIARLEDASDGESAEGEQQKLQRHPQNQERGWRKRALDEGYEGRVESSNSDKKARRIQSSI